MRIVLAAMDVELATAWQETCGAIDGVSIHQGSIFDVECQALVSPANSFGFMDGGIDALYSERFGWDLQLNLRRLILDKHHGELLIGQAEVVETGDARHPYLVAAPTMRVPMRLERTSINPYLATRAALLAAKKAGLTSLAFPGMGTGVGGRPARLCARQMRQAIEDVHLGQFRLPTSWAEASERHQLLYTDKPVRLQ